MASAHEESFVPELPELAVIPGTDHPEDWRYASRPHDLAEMISSPYSDEDRQRLADAASQAALADVKEAYMSPFVRIAAERAAKLALGLLELPAEDES
jgi:hypothetical protein